MSDAFEHRHPCLSQAVFHRVCKTGLNYQLKSYETDKPVLWPEMGIVIFLA